MPSGIWPLIAGAATGQVDAYVLTQGAWRPDRGVGVFAGWTRVETFSLLGVWLTVGAVALVLGLLALAAFSPARRIGVELWVWCAAYVLYLAAVGDLISSQLRFLLLAFPLAIALVALVPRPGWATRAWTWLLVAGLAVGQVAWVWTVWMQVLKEVTFLKAP